MISSWYSSGTGIEGRLSTEAFGENPSGNIGQDLRSRFNFTCSRARWYLPVACPNLFCLYNSFPSFFRFRAVSIRSFKFFLYFGSNICGSEVAIAVTWSRRCIIKTCLLCLNGLGLCSVSQDANYHCTEKRGCSESIPDA